MRDRRKQRAYDWGLLGILVYIEWVGRDICKAAILKEALRSFREYGVWWVHDTVVSKQGPVSVEDQRRCFHSLPNGKNMRTLFRIQEKEVGMSSPKPIQTLQSGRSVLVRGEEGSEVVEICDAEGSVEVSISIGAEGPVVKLSGAKLELEATDTVSVKARRFEVETTETARIHADGHLTLTSGLDTRMVADGEVHMLGTMIWLN